MQHPDSGNGRETAIAIVIAVVVALAVSVGWSRLGHSERADCCDTSDAAAPDLSAPLPPDPQVRAGRLRNGLRYFVRESHAQTGIELRLVVNAGSVLEDEDQRGLAHAVEHMAFRGTDHFPGHAIVDTLEALGMRSGTDLNAFTGFDDTEYDLSLPADSAQALERAVAILADWAHAVRFDSSDAARERGVVLGEWRSDRTAARRLADARTALLLGDTRYARRLPIGDTTVLKRFDVRAMRRFYRDWYRPDLMAVVAVGDFDAGRMEELLRHALGAIPEREDERTHPAFDARPQTGIRAATVTDPEASTVRVALWHLTPHRAARTIGDFRSALAEELFIDLLDARLTEAARRPDAPFLRTSFEKRRLTRTVDGFGLRADVAPSGVARGLQALVAEVTRVAREGFTATELERQKAVMRRAAESAYANGPGASQLADLYVEHFLSAETVLGRDDEFALRKRLIPEITLAEVSRFAAATAPDSGSLVLLSAPARLAVHMPDDSALVAAVRAAEGRPTTPYVDEGAHAEILASEPAPGSIVSSHARAGIGTIEWTLSNGMRVLVRPTHIESGRIQMESWAPGGASLASRAEYPSAYMSDRVVEATGVGTLGPTAMEKALAGHDVSVTPRVSDTEVGLSGQANPRDIELLFRLAYLYFTAPRADSAAFRVYRLRNEELLRSRGSDPDAAFDDTVSALLAGPPSHAAEGTPAFYRRVDLPRALAFYRERFANGRNFTTVIVGDFSLERVRPLVERYLASLPAGHEEQPRESSMPYPAGIIERTVRGGTDPTSHTRLVFAGPVTPYDQRASQQLRTLRELLQLRLEARLREALGATYDVSADLSVRTRPRAEYAFTVDFTSAPERADQLAREALTQVDDLRAHGPSPAELRKITAAQEHDLDDTSEDDDFWMSELRSHARLGWPLEDIVKHRSLVSTMTVDTLRDAAARYLSTQRYVRVTRLPVEPHTPGR